jgi:hypothetical protein
MPQFYETDDLSVWFGVCLVDEYESLDKEEQKEWIESHLGSASVLEDYAEKYIGMMVPFSAGSSPFYQAVMNSVDWEEVLEVVKNTIDEYVLKNAIDEENDE